MISTFNFRTFYRYSNSLQQWAEDPDKKHHEDEEIESKKETLAEREDSKSDAALKKARDWDEFKDGKSKKCVRYLNLKNVLEHSEVKRGSGNRANMS